MKIASIQTALVKLPTVEPLAGGPRPHVGGGTRDFFVVQVRTDEGVEGLGVTFLFGGLLSNALKSALDELCGLVIGEDPLANARIQQKLLKAVASAGPDGLAICAIAAIDIALWDIKGQVAGCPVARLAGGAVQRVPAYASGALRRDFSHEQLERCARTLVERGWTQMKMQLALPAPTNAQKELAAVRLVREVVGPDVDLMADINHNWDVRQALSLGPRLDEFGLYWLEDVVARDDYRGMGEIARALATPLASGESVYGLTPFRHMLEAGAVDIVMADVFRAGGITGWLRIAALAQAFNAPIVSHLVPEISVHLVAAVPNGLTVEYIPWSEALYEETPQPAGGSIAPFDRPGLGLKLAADTLQRYAEGLATIR
jgi:L-alanine-DL-glutamate epimerase-like enolase superfamily enzyme